MVRDHVCVAPGPCVFNVEMVSFFDFSHLMEKLFPCLQFFRYPAGKIQLLSTFLQKLIFDIGYAR